jgi:hypothetical protein
VAGLKGTTTSLPLLPFCLLQCEVKEGNKEVSFGWRKKKIREGIVMSIRHCSRNT